MMCSDDSSGIDANVGVLHSASSSGIPEAHLLPLQHDIHNIIQMTVASFCDLCFGCTKKCYLRMQIFLSKEFKSPGKFLGLLIFQCGHWAV